MALSSGPLPALNAVNLDGTPTTLQELCGEKYTVLKSACMTCPEFLKSYGEIETAYVDYAPHCVQFRYVYQSLRHPELGGLVEPQNIGERILHAKEAQRRMETRVPWVVDTLDDNIRVALRANSQTVYFISPQGEILYAGDHLNGPALREAIAREVGPATTYTTTADLDLPDLGRAQGTGQNADNGLQVKRSDGLVILATTADKPEDTYYVKLRAEADPALLETGTGRLFLGFYPDPIHNASWNNLTEPMKYVLTPPEGAVVTPNEQQAKQGPGEKDNQPRQFWVDVRADGPLAPMKLSLHYVACTPDMCIPLSHDYTITFKPANKNSRTFSFNRGQRTRQAQGAGGGGQRPRGR